MSMLMMKRETSMNIVLVCLLLSELSYCHVARWGQLEDNYMEMRLRKVLGQLVTLASSQGRITRRASDFEVEELLGITKGALFSRNPQWETRRNNLMPWSNPGASVGPNPAAFFGPDPGNLVGGSIGAGIIAGPKGMWASLGGKIGPLAIKPNGQNGTWFEQLGHGNGANAPSQNNVIWTITWPPNPSRNPFDIAGPPKVQETTTFSWFTKPSSTWPNWVTAKPANWDFGTTNQIQWSTAKPIWLQSSTINSNWFFNTTTTRPWFFKPKAAGGAPPEGPKAVNEWDTFTKEVPPWRKPNTTVLKPVSSTAPASKS